MTTLFSRGRKCRQTCGRGLAALALALILAAAAPVTSHAAKADNPAKRAVNPYADPARRPLLPERFDNPPAESMPGVLWFWHETTMTTTTIRQQMADMRQAGFSGIYMFPLASNPGYFTEEFYKLFDFVLREAKAQGMQLWLTCDTSIPTGHGGGIIVGGGKVGERTFEPRPDLRAQKVLHVAAQTTGGRALDLRGLFPGVATAPTSLGILPGGILTARGCDLVVGHQGRQWRDYTFSLDVKPHNWATGYGALAAYIPDTYTQTEWAFRADNRTESAYAWALSDRTELGNGKFALKKMIIKNGQVAAQLPSSPLPFALKENTFYHVEMRLTGSRIETIINGQSVDVTTDSTFSTGTVGLRLPPPEIGEFDNFKVTAPDGKVLYQNDFADASTVQFFAPPLAIEKVFAVAAMPIKNGKPTWAGMVDVSEPFLAGKPWQAPAGRWAVEFYARDFVKEMPATYPDLINPDVARRHTQIIYDEVVRRFPWAVGAPFKGFWSDEPSTAWSSGGFPWSNTLPATFKQAGLTPAQGLAAVFNDLGREGLVARAHYYKAFIDGWSDPFYRLQGEWADRHGLEFITNPTTDDSPPSPAYYGGNGLQFNQWSSVPGVDAIYGQILPTVRSLIPRWATSSANQTGRERVMYEVFGGYGWDVSPELVRYVNANLMVRGCNQACYHAYWSNPNAVYFAPPFDPANPWWFAQGQISLWNGRAQEVGLGLSISDVALINPSSTVQGQPFMGGWGELDASFREAAYALEDVQATFDLLEEMSLNGDPTMKNYQAKVAGNGSLKVGRQAYRVAVLPSPVSFSLKAAETLRQWVKKGGVVIAYKSLPQQEISGRDHDLKAVAEDLFGAAPATGQKRAVGKGWTALAGTPEELRMLLRRAEASAIGVAPNVDKLRVLRRQRGADTVYLLMNEGEKAVRPTLAFPLACGAPEIWNPDIGERRVAPIFEVEGAQTRLPLRLEPYQMLAVVFRQEAAQAKAAHLTNSALEVTEVQAAEDGQTLRAQVLSYKPGVFDLAGVSSHQKRLTGQVEIPVLPKPLTLAGPWRFRFERAGEKWQERVLGSWTELDKTWSGQGTYETTFTVPADMLAAGRRLTLDLGQVREVAEVTINGQKAGTLLWRPYRLDATKLLKAGENRLAVRVTNTGGNSHGKPQPSGLLGPVRLAAAALASVELKEQ